MKGEFEKRVKEKLVTIIQVDEVFGSPMIAIAPRDLQRVFLDLVDDARKEFIIYMSAEWEWGDEDDYITYITEKIKKWFGEANE